MSPRARNLQTATEDTYSAKFFNSDPDSVGYRANAAEILGSLVYIGIERSHKRVTVHFEFGCIVVKHSANQVVGSDCHVDAVPCKESHGFEDKPIREVYGIGIHIHRLLQGVACDVGGKNATIEDEHEIACHGSNGAFHY